MSEPPRKSALTIILLVIVVVMGAEILFLMYQNRQLRARLNDPASFYRTLQSNQRVPELTSRDINGNPVEIHYSDESPYTLLIWFSPSCHVCEENLDFWKQLLGPALPHKVRYLALCAATVEEARAYASAHGISYTVVAVTDDRLVSAYNGYVLPQTALISPNGLIVESWAGALGSAQQDNIRSTLNKI
jgi:hypothetical protein